jgi:hypothetical protein
MVTCASRSAVAIDRSAPDKDDGMNGWLYLGLIAGIFAVGCVVGFDILKLLSMSREVPNVEYLGFAGLMTSAVLLYRDRQNGLS